MDYNLGTANKQEFMPEFVNGYIKKRCWNVFSGCLRLSGITELVALLNLVELNEKLLWGNFLKISLAYFAQNYTADSRSDLLLMKYKICTILICWDYLLIINLLDRIASKKKTEKKAVEGQLHLTLFTPTGTLVSQLNFSFIWTLKMLYSKPNSAYSKLYKTNLVVKGLKMEIICQRLAMQKFLSFRFNYG